MSQYLHCQRLQENVFYLNKKGRELIGSTKVRTRMENIEHAVMRNEIYIQFDKPEIWEPEFKITENETGKTILVSDVRFKAGDAHYLVEVDHRQHMINNRRKIDKYKEIKKMNNGFLPMLIWLTKVDSRQKTLEEYMEQKGIEGYVMTLNDVY